MVIQILISLFTRASDRQITLTGDSHASDLPSPGLRLGVGPTSQFPTSQAPTDKINPLNPGPSWLHGNADFNLFLYLPGPVTDR